MSKTKRPIGKQKEQIKEGGISGLNIDKIIPPKYQSAAALGIIVLSFLIFFAPMYFGGKTFQSGDIVTSISYTTFVNTYDSRLWNPLVFGGFPTAASISALRWYDFIAEGYGAAGRAFSSLFSVDYAGYTFHLLILAFTMFFFMRTLKVSKWVSLLVSMSVVFSTGIIVFLFIGHVSKLPALAMFPLIFLILFRFQTKIRLLEILLLVVALHLMVITLHVQIIFYILFSVGIYFFYYITRTLIKKEKEFTVRILKSLAVFSIAAIISVLMSFDEISQIYEYTPYSTRGSESINEKTSGVSEETGSEFYDYHTNWSFSPGEILTFIVPSYYGFGSVTYKGPLSREQEMEIQTYFGQMPFVDVPMYMGVVVFFFALYGIYIRRKEAFVHFLAILAGIALIISFGKNFPVLFDLMFYNFPFFNKFRVPSMILVLVQITLPILAGLAVMRIIEMKNNPERKQIQILRNISFVFGGLFVLSIILSGPVQSWFISHMINAGEKGARLSQIGDFISSMFHTDLMFAFGLTALSFGAAYLYLSNKFSEHAFVIALLILIMIDLWRIDSRAAKYIEAPVVKGIFETPGYVNAIKNQNDKDPFRILNIKQDGTPGSLNQPQNFYAYFLIEDLYGYSGIKPRTYQDIMDVVGPVNPVLWRMLNTRYIVSDKQFNDPNFTQIFSDGKTFLYKFEGALPRMYFVNSTQKAEGLTILNNIKTNSFDPKNIAYLEEDIKVDVPGAEASVNIRKYENEYISADVNATGNNFLFLGNTYYPVSWKATIDGNETKIFKANYGYSGIVVPPGKHKIEFRYYPANYYIGKYIALILSSLTIIGIAAIIITGTRKRRIKD